MAGVLIHDVSGYSGTKYNLKIPSLTDPANIQEAMMLFHYGIDNYDGNVEPANDSVFGNLRDFDDRIAQLEETEVVQLDGTPNQIISSGSVGFVTLSLSNELIAPGSLQVTSSGSFGSTLSVQGNLSTQSTFSALSSASFGGDVNVSGNVEIEQDVVIGSSSANYLNVTGSALFTEQVNALKGMNIFENDTERDDAIITPVPGIVSFLTDTNSQNIYNGSSWEEVVTTTKTSTLTNKTLNSPLINSAILKSPEEFTSVSATAATGTLNIDLLDSSVKFFTANATGNWTFNFRGNSSTTLNNSLNVNDSISCAILVTNGATPYRSTAYQVDGSSVTPKWQGGDAPSAGNASSVDIYTFTIIKTANATFSVFGGQSQFA